MNRETISLCMIVKDEEDVLARCLESVNGLVDEIIVVDTGSKDNSINIAKQHGAKVVSIPWENDFASARNVALDHATMDWVLQLDADEYILDGMKDGFIETVSNRHATDAYMVGITNLRSGGVIGLTHLYSRLFRNDPSIRYAGRIHEQVVRDGVPVKAAETSLRIMHSGYTTEVVEKKGKRKRNINLLKQEIARQPRNGFHHYNLSNEWMGQNEYGKALESAKKAYKLGRGRTYQSNAFMNMIGALYHLKRYTEALELARQGQRVFTGYTDLVFMEGVILEELGCTEDAKTVFRKALVTGESKGGYMTKKGIGSLIPAERLAYYSVRERRYDDASQYLILLLGFDKKNKRYWAELIRMMKRQWSNDQVYDYIEVMLAGAKYTEMRNYLYIKHCIEKGVLDLPLNISKNIDIEQDARIAWLAGKWGDAEGYFRRGIETIGERLIPVAVAFSLDTNNQDFLNHLCEVNETAKLIYEFLEGGQIVQNRQDTIFVDVMTELVERRRFDLFERLYPMKSFFQPAVLKGMGHMLDARHFDELAIECMVSYLNKVPKDVTCWLRVSELLLVAGMVDESKMFAQSAKSNGDRGFRSIEITIECLEKTGDTKGVSLLSKEALAQYPGSPYLLRKYQGTKQRG